MLVPVQETMEAKRRRPGATLKENAHPAPSVSSEAALPCVTFAFTIVGVAFAIRVPPRPADWPHWSAVVRLMRYAGEPELANLWHSKNCPALAEQALPQTDVMFNVVVLR
jgi:hypothetical protein